MRVHPLLAKHGRSALIIVVGTIVSLFLVRLTEAGTLTPVALPGATMHSVEEIYDSLVGSSYDSSGVNADEQGSALQISKCILLHLTASSSAECP
jgi:hypothetical protein